MKINLDKELEAIKRMEMARGRARQEQAGVDQPVRLDFSANLTRELYDAGQRIWEACGTAEGTRPRDVTMEKLWSQINRGTSCLTEADFLAFSQLTWKQMRVLAPDLVEGMRLDTALAKAKEKWTSRIRDRGGRTSR